jgi:hypothetical protein
MEPLNDKELGDLLKKWQAPPAPPGLEGRLFPGTRGLPWWRWLLGGSVRVPVPVCIIALVILLVSVFATTRTSQAPEPSLREVKFSDFQPVKQLQPRIIRGAYESN